MLLIKLILIISNSVIENWFQIQKKFNDGDFFWHIQITINLRYAGSDFSLKWADFRYHWSETITCGPEKSDPGGLKAGRTENPIRVQLQFQWSAYFSIPKYQSAHFSVNQHTTLHISIH